MASLQAFKKKKTHKKCFYSPDNILCFSYLVLVVDEEKIVVLIDCRLLYPSLVHMQTLYLQGNCNANVYFL